MNIFDMAQLAAELELPSRFFVTRDRGELAFERLTAALQAVPEEGSLILQFPPSQVMDVSFVDETIIRLGPEIVAGKPGNRRLLLQGLTQHSKDNIDAAIRPQPVNIAFLARPPDPT